MKTSVRISILLIAILLIAITLFILERDTNKTSFFDQVPKIANIFNMEKDSKYSKAIEIDNNGGGYINTTSISVSELIGKKVILLDIWTYSCINCQRTLPYLNSWYEKYKDQGLEIIGIHTPEFAFEKEYANVLAATKKFNVKYPVVLDNNYITWKRYQNNYWPRKYLIDIDGYVVYDHIGEGGYAQTEKKVQQLLEERKKKLKQKDKVVGGTVKPSNVEKVDFSLSRSPEIYFGAWRNTAFGNGAQLKIGVQILKKPESYKKNILYLTGKWDIQKEYAKNLEVGSKIIFKYKAEKVFMVAESDKEVKVRIYRDGKLVTNNAGSSVKNGIVTIQKSELYRLIEEQKGTGEHLLEIEILSPRLKAYTFTFG